MQPIARETPERFSNSLLKSTATAKLSLLERTAVTFGSGRSTVSASPDNASVATSACSDLYSTVTLSVSPFFSKR